MYYHKSALLSVLILAFFFMPTTLFAATEDANANDFDLYLNGDFFQADPSLGEPYINEDNRTMIPLRLVNTYFGFHTSWFEDGEILIRREDPADTIRLQVGSLAYTHKGEEKELRTPPTIRQDRAYLPARDFVELYGSIHWDGDRRKVHIYPEKGYQTTYRIHENGNILRHDGATEKELRLPKDYRFSPITSSIFAQKLIDGKTYLRIKPNKNHAIQVDLFRDDGDQLTLLASKINGTSSFTLDDTYLYYTDGVSQGPWSSYINPHLLYVQNQDGDIREFILDFPINDSLLFKKDNEVYAFQPSGQIQRLPLNY